MINPQPAAIGLNEMARSPCLDKATAQPAQKRALAPEIAMDALVGTRAHGKGAPDASQRWLGDAAPAPGTPQRATPTKRPVSADLPSEPAGPIAQESLRLQCYRVGALIRSLGMVQNAYLRVSPVIAQKGLSVPCAGSEGRVQQRHIQRDRLQTMTPGAGRASGAAEVAAPRLTRAACRKLAVTG